MCLSCQMSMLEDHEQVGGVPCLVHPMILTTPEDSENQEQGRGCYHCFCADSGCEDVSNCPVCGSGDGPGWMDAFFDRDMKDERERLVLAIKRFIDESSK